MDDLLRYAGQEFKLDKKPKESDSTLREHLQAIAEQTGTTPEELDNPEPNLAVQHLLVIFQQLSLSRQAGMVLNPITYSEIVAWSQLYQTRLSMWEIDVLKRIDLVFLNIQNE
ncbi:phage tail assembly chaperone [Pasteurella multocida]|uniref:phage tail assembly chaperone n=1 Tax=Pasteurella multocida TaxID=747 RepID=UPI003BAF25F5